MTDSIYSDSIFEPEVQFSVVPEQKKEGARAAAPVTVATGFLRTAVASGVLSLALFSAPAIVGVSQNVVHPSLLNLSSDRLDYSPGAWRVRFESRLKSLLDLNEGWEPGAPRISEVAAAALRNILSEAEVPSLTPPAVVPTVEGGLQVEWHENSVDVEVRSTPTGEIFAFYSIGNDEREIAIQKPRQLRRLLRHVTADRSNA